MHIEDHKCLSHVTNFSCSVAATTRKLYEKKLLKLKEPSQELSSFIATPTFSSSTENNKQNGNDDSDQFSDSEEDPKTEFRLDKQEPLKSKTKTSLSLKQRRIAENNQVETTVPFPVHDPVISENTPIAVVASSNETLSEQFEFQQVVNRVPGNTKHADPILSISDFSELPRRTPKKPLMTAEVIEKMSTEVTRLERDILKEMFPYEASTPTGISASCRRPIKGAAGRPIEFSDYRLEETYSSKYIPKYVASAEVQKEKTTKKHSIPLWIKFLLFFIVTIFLAFVYQSMEINQGNPFSKFLTSESPQKTTD
ncbi:hypothetical protein Chor_010113 [Crotalus horridus]